MVLPALQVRVPNPANALLQAEQIRGARAQNRALTQQEAGRNALLTAFQGGIPTTAAGRQAAVNTVAQAAPLQGLQLQQHFSEADAREGRLVARNFVGVRDQATYDQARTALQRQGVDVSQMPPQFNQQFVQSSIQAAQSLESLLAQGTGFTLSPGQTRFDASGRPIGSLPAAPTSGGFTLAPGAARFDAAGNPIASQPATPPRPTQRETDIAALEARGFTRQQSEDIAAGRVRIATDPVTGESQLVNVATGATGPLGAPESAPAGPVLTAAERGRLFNQNASIERVLGLSEGLPESAAAGTGPRGNLGALMNSLAGIAGRNAPIPAPEIAAARQDIRLFNQIAKTAIVNNPRFPVAEQKIIERMLPNADAFFRNPSVEFNKVLQLQEFLREMQAGNSQSLGVAAPQPTVGGESLPTLQSQSEFDALPSGARYINPDDGQIYRKP